MIAIPSPDPGHGTQWGTECFALELQDGEPLDSHCWKNEKEEIASALQYGTLEDTNWEYGEVIKGMLTAELIRELLEWKCTEEDVYEKLTPYFTLQAGNVCSEHYGTEIYLEQEPEKDEKIQQILDRISAYASISEYQKEQDR